MLNSWSIHQKVRHFTISFRPTYKNTLRLNVVFTGTFINSNKPVAVFAGNERSGIPYQAYVGWDHAADQMPHIATSVDLDSSLGSSYRYDVLPTAGNELYDTYQ